MSTAKQPLVAARQLVATADWRLLGRLGRIELHW